MDSLCWIRVRRLISAATSVGIVLLIPVLGVVIGAVRPGGAGSLPAIAPWINWVASIGFCIALVIAVFETIEKYRRLTYDPTWVLKFQELFTALSDETEERPRAAWLLRRHKNDLANITHDGEMRKTLGPIDEVFDLLQDIAFYTRGGQMSPETASHNFYHWLQGYQDSARHYLAAWKEMEPGRWSDLDWLRRVTDDVEREWSKDAPSELSEAKCEEFLVQEIGDWTPDESGKSRP
jgi:hypothetical protein